MWSELFTREFVIVANKSQPPHPVEVSKNVPEIHDISINSTQLDGFLYPHYIFLALHKVCWRRGGVTNFDYVLQLSCTASREFVRLNVVTTETGRNVKENVWGVENAAEVAQTVEKLLDRFARVVF